MGADLGLADTGKALPSHRLAAISKGQAAGHGLHSGQDGVNCSTMVVLAVCPSGPVAVIETSSCCMPGGGVPSKRRLTGSKRSQSGSFCPLALCALICIDAAGSACWKVCAGKVKLKGLPAGTVKGSKLWTATKPVPAVAGACAAVAVVVGVALTGLSTSSRTPSEDVAPAADGVAEAPAAALAGLEVPGLEPVPLAETVAGAVEDVGASTGEATATLEVAAVFTGAELDGAKVVAGAFVRPAVVASPSLSRVVLLAALS